MQQSNSLPFLNLNRQVVALDRTVQMLVQYQRLLYVELLHIKRKLGMDEPIEPEQAAQMSPQQMMMAQQQMNSNSSRRSNQQFNSQELDLASIQRALAVQTMNPSQGSSRKRNQQSVSSTVMESAPMSASNIDN